MCKPGDRFRCGAVWEPGRTLTHPRHRGTILLHPHVFEVLDPAGRLVLFGSCCSVAHVTELEFVAAVLENRFGNSDADEWWD